MAWWGWPLKMPEPIPAPERPADTGQVSVNGLAKLVLQRKGYGDSNWQDAVTCLFNPEKITVDKKNKYKTAAQAGINMGHPSFGGGQPAKMKLELFFDTSDTGEDVRSYTDKVLALTLVEDVRTIPNFKHTPDVRFVWGKMVSFLGHLKKVKIDFLMFQADGTPIRAKAKVDLEQRVDSDKFLPQNPTSRSAARKMRIVLDGERLDYIAYQEYGSSAHWRYLAEVNRLSNPLELRPGQVLNIVPLPKKGYQG